MLAQELNTNQTQLNAVTAKLEELKKTATSTSREKNCEEGKGKQFKEIESLRAQLSAVQKKNEKLKGGMFVMSSTFTENHPRRSCLDHSAEYYDSVAAGLLTGRPEEEVSGFQGDVLKELSTVHARARKAMKSMVKALWPSDIPPESMEGLTNLFKGARRWFELWKTSAQPRSPISFGDYCRSKWPRVA